MLAGAVCKATAPKRFALPAVLAHARYASTGTSSQAPLAAEPALACAPKRGDQIYDPTCGSGSLLLKCAREVRANSGGSRKYALFAQEAIGSTWALAKMNMFLHGETNHRIEWGNTIANPKLRSKEDQLRLFDVVVANPPFSLDKWAAEKASADKFGRFRRGLPPELIIGLLSPVRLLEFVRYFLIFDEKKGKIAARYQQVYGVKAMLERIAMRNRDGGREGSVIWHTTGSGKSFTMVFLLKALLTNDELARCRILIVTDRTDLERQLSKTFITGGVFGSALATKKESEKAKAESGRDLAERIGSGTARIMFTLLQKIKSATKLPECRNESPDMIVLVDEGHRSHGGEAHERMRTALPNAAFVAFTGTPLLKDDKTRSKFGPILHAYTMQRAVEDGAVTQLLYEERKPLLDINEKAVDAWFQKRTQGLSYKQKGDLKRKFANRGAI